MYRSFFSPTFSGRQVLERSVSESDPHLTFGVRKATLIAGRDEMVATPQIKRFGTLGHIGLMKLYNGRSDRTFSMVARSAWRQVPRGELRRGNGGCESDLAHGSFSYSVFIPHMGDRLNELAALAEVEEWDYQHTHSDRPRHDLLQLLHHPIPRWRRKERLLFLMTGNSSLSTQG